MFPVPFGEYIPFPFGGLVSKITSEIGDFEPGKRVVVFDAGPQRVGPFICYESAFPGLVRRFAAAGATVFVNLSNDGYFGRTAAREQNLSLVRMRAA
jgi:apolipoprotein N-acyltransferase